MVPLSNAPRRPAGNTALAPLSASHEDRYARSWRRRKQPRLPVEPGRGRDVPGEPRPPGLIRLDTPREQGHPAAVQDPEPADLTGARTSAGPVRPGWPPSRPP